MNEVEIKNVLADIKKHPMFDLELFQQRNYDALISVGGDICTITFYAIRLEDAINNSCQWQYIYFKRK